MKNKTFQEFKRNLDSTTRESDWKPSLAKKKATSLTSLNKLLSRYRFLTLPFRVPNLYQFFDLADRVVVNDT